MGRRNSVTVIGMHRAIAELMEYSGGLITRKGHPELHTRIDYAVRRGTLHPLLPGVYTYPELRNDWRTRARAVGLWSDNALLMGEVGAAFSFWPELTPSVIEVACPWRQPPRPGYRFVQRRVPQQLTGRLSGVPAIYPALTTLDLIPHYGGDIIDRALRSRLVTVEDLVEALQLTSRRPGNKDRRTNLLDSRGNAWSAAERLAHRHLYAADITQWTANVPVRAGGQNYFLDIEMDDCPLVLEIDGKIHMRPDMFESDRRRGNHLLLAGKQVMHFTWKILTEEPDWFIEMTRRGLAKFRH